MLKYHKILICLLAITLIPILLVFAFLTNKKTPVSAQVGLVCDEPIPTAESLEQSLELMADTYRELQNLRDYLTFALEELQSEVSDLYQDPEEVCDFSVCRPQVIDTAPALKLKVSYFFGVSTLAEAHIPLCTPKECLGNPCPDLNDHLEVLEGMKSGIEGSYEIIRDIFTQETVPITMDIKKETEELGDFIRKPELVRRKLELSREWLHPTAEAQKRSCALSELERKKVDAGEIGERYPMRCTDALSQGLYWPRVWSENCENDCNEGPTEECKACLGQDPGLLASVLAKINFKIYGICGTFCQEELSLECLNCLCADLSEKECTAWLCGGNYNNYVCCHETPLE